MYRLYLDQMISSRVARDLRSVGYDVIKASESGQQRADDYMILAKAIEEHRILITLDDHFGDWAVLPLSRHPGVIRVKANPATSAVIAKILLPFLQMHTPERFGNRLIILSSSRARWIRTDQGWENDPPKLP